MKQYSMEEAILLTIEAIRHIGDRKIDPDRTTISGYKYLTDFIRKTKSSKIVESLTELLNEYKELSNHGITFVDPEDQKDDEADSKKKKENPLTENTTASAPAEKKTETPSKKTPHLIKREESTEPENQESNTTKIVRPVPISEGFVAIDWLRNIPGDKYMINQKGTVVNRYNGRNNYSFLTAGRLHVKLVGEQSGKNQTSLTVALHELMSHAFPPEPKKENLQTTINGKYHIEDVTKPVDKSAISKKPVAVDLTGDKPVFLDNPEELKNRKPDKTDQEGHYDIPDEGDHMLISWLTPLGIPADKYVIYKSGRIFNRYSNIWLSITVSANSKNGYVSLNASPGGVGETHGEGVAKSFNCNFAQLMITAFVRKGKPDDAVKSGRFYRIDYSKPFSLDNIDYSRLK